MLDPAIDPSLSSLALTALFGLIVGSFLNVVIHRLPRMMQAEWEDQAAELRGEPPRERARYDLVSPRSHCPHCRHPIGVLHNIPLLSWLALRGRCAHCGAAIGWRYPVVELLGALLALAALWRYGAGVAGFGAFVLGCFLVTLAFIDLDTQLLPDDLTLPLLWLGLAFNLAGTFAPLADAVVGAMLGYATLWTVYMLFRFATGKEGMGYGDFKLLAALGAWFGWQAVPGMVVIAALAGATVGIGLIAFGRHARGVPIPFGPYLAGAGLLALFVSVPLGDLFAAGFAGGWSSGFAGGASGG
jgi:leader peptidase (prepilin peptidase) / N-methyltransferase